MQAFPFNTDGFSAGGSNLLFENNHIENGDDCLTVGSGGKNVTFRNTYCEGGHGLSIGSLGKGGAVADVQNIWSVMPTYSFARGIANRVLLMYVIRIENIVMKDCLYGARFKSWTGGNGLARKYVLDIICLVRTAC